LDQKTGRPPAEATTAGAEFVATQIGPGLTSTASRCIVALRMKLPADAVIAREKITSYLLRKLPENDKSGFLALAGYTIENPDRLESDIRAQILTQEAEFVETTEYGDKHCIRADITGPNGQSLRVMTIWLTEEATGTTKFITLYPAKTT
jgi:hypothetical protein